DAPSKPAIRRLIEARVRRKELVAVALEGAGKQEHWAEPATLETAGARNAELVHILSPFDPLIIQRKRTHLFFDYEHRFEAYVPKAKRRTSLRGLCPQGEAAVRLFCAAGPRRWRHRCRHRSQDRPQKAGAAGAEM